MNERNPSGAVGQVSPVDAEHDRLPAGEDLVERVRAATVMPVTRLDKSGLSLSFSTAKERAIAPLVGLYLGYAVVRLPEVFDQLAVPRGPMVMMLIFLTMLVVATPSEGWKAIWNRSLPFRHVAALLCIAVGTAPLGIWLSGSLEFLRERYAISLVVFLTCLVFLRDPRALRVAATIFVLSATAVSADVVITFDPNAPMLDSDGVPVEAEIPLDQLGLRRLEVVGKSLDPNDFGAVIAVAFPLALWLSVGSFGRRLVWTGAAGIMIMAIVPTQSRGSMLGILAASAAVMGAGARGWRRILTILLVGAGIAAFLYMAISSGASGRFGDFSGDDYNLTNAGRIYFWKQGLVWMIKRPWGYGIANFPTYFDTINGSFTSAHSIWVQHGMELGIAGLGVFVALCATLWRGLLATRRAALANVGQVRGAQELAVQAGHMLAMLIGVLVCGTFLSNAYVPMMYMALGMCAATLLAADSLTVNAIPGPAAIAPHVHVPANGRRRRVLVPPNSAGP
jgi:O-antigen ligase